MPLLKYFSFVGSALFLLLLAVNFILPDVKNKSSHDEVDRPVIRINSIEKLPEKVVFDTSLPTVVPPMTVLVTYLPGPQSAFDFAQITPGPLPTFSRITNSLATFAVMSRPGISKRDERPAAKANIDVRRHRTMPTSAPPIRVSLIDAIRSRFGHSFFSTHPPLLH
jgi:hypothetical protein